MTKNQSNEKRATAKVMRDPKPNLLKKENQDFRKVMDDLFQAAKVSCSGQEQPTGVYFATFEVPIELTDEWIELLKSVEFFKSISLNGRTLIGIDYGWGEYKVSDSYLKK